MGESRKQSAASPCAACKLLRRRCARDCVFAPYFPAEEPHKFASVHKVFGASNVNKMLQELGEEQRGDAVSSMVYEANARVRDPVYGCVGAISSLQKQVDILQTQLALAQAEVVQLRLKQFSSVINSTTTNNSHDYHINDNNIDNNNNNNNNLSSSPSSHDDTTPPLFNMGMVVDQVNMGESLWSC